jgi:acyl carrier protein
MATLDEVKEYITESFAPDTTPSDLPDDVDLNATGILTSLSTVQLLGWCGKRYHIPINSMAIDPAQLKTPYGIAQFIEANRTN